MAATAPQQSAPVPAAWRTTRRHRTPTVLQMEAVECGAAALAIVLGYHGRIVPLEELRLACGVSRDGAKAVNVVRAARTFGFTAKGFRMETVPELAAAPLPVIVFWNFSHFLVVEGLGRDCVWINDPATGPRTLTRDEFEAGFTGVVLTFEPGPEFVRGGQRPGTIRALRQRLRGSEPALAFVLLASLALVVPGLLLPACVQFFVDQVLTAGHSGWVAPLVLALVATALLRGLLTWMQQHALQRLETRLSLTSSSGFFRHVLRLPVAFFTQRFAGEIGSRVGINDLVAQMLSGQLATAALALLQIGFFALAMLQHSVLLTVLALGFAAANLLALRRLARAQADGFQRIMQDQGRLVGTTIAGLQAIESIKAMGGESDFFARWAGYHAKALGAEQRQGGSLHLLQAVPVLLTGLGQAAILGVGGWLVLENRLTIGGLAAFQTLMASFLAPVNLLVRLGSSIQLVDGGLKRLDDVLRFPPERAADETAAAPAEGPRTIKLSGTLELRDVTFGYSRLEPPLIENFSLTLQPGQRVALIGPTGCGKSTVARLVAGLYEPWSGEVRFDGRLRREIPRAVLGHSLALVDQDVFLFDGTVRENLALWDATAPEAALIAAAKDACIHDVIAARPGGYDSRVEEGGRNFSGGQRQRMDLARALVNDPTVLVLDEATSALDVRTEHAIDRHLRRRGCTCLIVAHRLSTIRDCDEIIVMDRGRIVQRGTHAALVAQGGAYSALVQDE